MAPRGGEGSQVTFRIIYKEKVYNAAEYAEAFNTASKGCVRRAALEYLRRTAQDRSTAIPSKEIEKILSKKRIQNTKQRRKRES